MWKVYKINLNNTDRAEGTESDEYNIPRGYIVDGIISSTADSISLILKPDGSEHITYHIDRQGRLINGVSGEVIQSWISDDRPRQGRNEDTQPSSPSNFTTGSTWVSSGIGSTGGVLTVSGVNVNTGTVTLSNAMDEPARDGTWDVTGNDVQILDPTTGITHVGRY